MIKKKKDTCFNPWFGYLVILVVCVMISAAIFVEFKGRPRKHGKRRMPARVTAVAPAAAVQVDFADAPPNAVKLIF